MSGHSKNKTSLYKKPSVIFLIIFLICLFILPSCAAGVFGNRQENGSGDPETAIAPEDEEPSLYQGQNYIDLYNNSVRKRSVNHYNYWDMYWVSINGNYYGYPTNFRGYIYNSEFFVKSAFVPWNYAYYPGATDGYTEDRLLYEFNIGEFINLNIDISSITSIVLSVNVTAQTQGAYSVKVYDMQNWEDGQFYRAEDDYNTASAFLKDISGTFGTTSTKVTVDLTAPVLQDLNALKNFSGIMINPTGYISALYFSNPVLRISYDPSKGEITVPGTPQGNAGPETGISCTYTTTGSTSTTGATVEYRFSWGDGTYSDWSLSKSAVKTWNNTNVNFVRAEARPQGYPERTKYSQYLYVMPHAPVIEDITLPGIPQGDTIPAMGAQYTYKTSGATSSLGHTLEYRFNWGDGTYSVWSASKTAAKIWGSLTQRSVQAEARCQTHPDKTNTSSALAVTPIASNKYIDITGSDIVHYSLYEKLYTGVFGADGTDLHVGLSRNFDAYTHQQWGYEYKGFAEMKLQAFYASGIAKANIVKVEFISNIISGGSNTQLIVSDQTVGEDGTYSANSLHFNTGCTTITTLTYPEYSAGLRTNVTAAITTDINNNKNWTGIILSVPYADNCNALFSGESAFLRIYYR